MNPIDEQRLKVLQQRRKYIAIMMDDLKTELKATNQEITEIQARYAPEPGDPALAQRVGFGRL